MAAAPPRVVERVLSRVRREGGCLVSAYGSSDGIRYASIGWNEEGVFQRRLVHRVAWEAVHGPVPPDMTVDHTCHNRRCVNVEHLRLLTATNNSRRQAPGIDFPVDWICRRGHPASALHQYKRKNRTSWGCRLCKDISRKSWAAKNPDAGKQWAARTAESLTPDDPRHGKASTYGALKCRCSACSAAKRAKRRKHGQAFIDGGGETP